MGNAGVFLRYYFTTGMAAAMTTMAVVAASICLRWPRYSRTVTIGASGAIYGLLLAYGLTFPNRPIYMYFVFPIPAKYFVMIMGGIALLSSVGDSGGGIAHITHLGGLVAGYVLLRGTASAPPKKCVTAICAGKWSARGKNSASTQAGGGTTGTSTCTESGTLRIRPAQVAQRQPPAAERQSQQRAQQAAMPLASVRYA